MIKIAVLGYGTIGSGVVEVLETNREHITQTAGQEIEVKYVLDLRDFPGDPIQEKIVHDYEIIKNDPEIQIVVEAMGGVEPAYPWLYHRKRLGKLQERRHCLRDPSSGRFKGIRQAPGADLHPVHKS